MSSRFHRLRYAQSLPFVLLATTALAQSAPVGPPANSLVVDPQQGATPRPVDTPSSTFNPPAATLPPAPAVSEPSAPRAVSGPTINLQPLRGPTTLETAEGLRRLPERDGALPAPSGNPLAIDARTDPVLRLAIASTDPDAFHAAIRSVVERNPSAAEADARSDEAVAARNEARALQYPVADLSVSYFKVLGRDFSNDPRNILERSRPAYRTDANVRVSMPVIDFGAAYYRIQAGNNRIDWATASKDDVATQVALRGVASWYQVFGYRALVSLSQSFVESQTALRGAIQSRVKQGYAAPGDVAQVESYIAAAEAQLATYRRQLASAEAQYTALTGAPPPPGLGRAPSYTASDLTAEQVRLDAESIPAVRAAKASADAARFDWRAARANALPAVSASVDAGRYGVIENNRDYDIRGTVTLSQRLGGGSVQRISQAAARSRGAQAAFDRVQTDAVRDATIAWADVQALEASEAAIRENYLATRQSRDVLAERFRVSRGTLFDLLAAETNYFNVAARYVETVTELDITRYVLLARRGKMLDAFGIEPAQMGRR